MYIELFDMLSPYRQSKVDFSLEPPEVRTELKYGQRLLNQLLFAERRGSTVDALAAQQRFSQWAHKAFPETLRELTPHIHSACAWAEKQEHPLSAFPRAVILFCGCLLHIKETAISVPLLKRARLLAHDSRELKAVSSINLAIALTQLSPESAIDEWINAVRMMPISLWSRYPSLTQGAYITLRTQRRDFEQDSNLYKLMESASLAEWIFAALSTNEAKGAHFQ